jgi:hypothetical protein
MLRKKIDWYLIMIFNIIPENMRRNFTFLSENGPREVRVLNPIGDGQCFFTCIADCISQQNPEGQILDPQEIRTFISTELERLKNVTLPGLNLTPNQYFDSKYAPRVQDRESLVNFSYIDRITQEGKTLSEKPLNVDCFGQYLDLMMHPKTSADNLIVAMCAHAFGLNLCVYTQSVTEDQETSDLPGTELFISMGFRKVDAEEALKQTNCDFLAALDNLTSKPLGHSEDELVWRTQFYNTESTRHLDCVELLNTDDHFMLVLSKEAEESRRICLPDIPEELLEEPVQHHVPPSFEHAQFGSSHDLIIRPDDFFDACSRVVVAQSFPDFVNVHVEFNCVYADINHVHLFGSLEFIEHDSVKYRVVSFTMANGTQVSYHGCIANLSKGSEKTAFFNQLYQVIQHQNVVSVRLAKL